MLPRYGNTHTESSSTGLQTTRLREDAGRITRAAAGGTEDYLVIFCGSGATAAVNKLVGILELRRLEMPPEGERPAVSDPYEHHSNELPWHEPVAAVVVIGQDSDGHIDLERPEAALRRYADRPLRIGSFSAASNVTGILTDTNRVARLLHAHGALPFWDYAAAAPYVPIRFSESAPGTNDHKDALVLSRTGSSAARRPPASSSCGANRSGNRAPTTPGGGTVSLVGPLGHRCRTTRSPVRRAAPRPCVTSAPCTSTPTSPPP